MTEQQVRVTNNDVGCGLVILTVALLIGGCNMSAAICKRLEGIERVIEKIQPATGKEQTSE